ncbi:MAG: hypothetical protein KJZ72_12290 [Anaerolineales bacterium]|nr:hypothetical protein [Anaerolineales bacterium]
MIQIETNTKIYRPIKQVFDFVSTPENDFQWQYGTLASSRIPGDASFIIGSFFRSIGHLMGRRNLSMFEVTEYDLDKIYGFKSLSGPLNSHTTYTFEMSRGSTKVGISIQLKVQVTHPAMINEVSLKKQIKENLKLLKELLEEDTARPIIL